MEIIYHLNFHIVKNSEHSIILNIDDSLLKEHDIQDEDQLSDFLYDATEYYLEIKDLNDYFKKSEEEYLKQEREDSEYLYRLRKGDIETELE